MALYRGTLGIMGSVVPMLHSIPAATSLYREVPLTFPVPLTSLEAVGGEWVALATAGGTREG